MYWYKTALLLGIDCSECGLYGDASPVFWIKQNVKHFKMFWLIWF